jgi:transcriptional regulator with XRE-family HTH domain
MAELAARSKVSKDTIRRFENGEGVLPRTVDSLKVALERAGVEFLVGEQRPKELELHLPDGMIVRKKRG